MGQLQALPFPFPRAPDFPSPFPFPAPAMQASLDLEFSAVQICDARFLTRCIKGTDESLSRVDFSVPLMYHDPNDLRSQIRFRILPKKRTLCHAYAHISRPLVTPCTNILTVP